jgi:hypothetical protein
MEVSNKVIAVLLIVFALVSFYAMFSSGDKVTNFKYDWIVTKGVLNNEALNDIHSKGSELINSFMVNDTTFVYYFKTEVK